MKRLLKKLIPKKVMQPLLKPYHLSRAILANIMYGFPARNLRVIGITGTNGKTTVANYLSSILREAECSVGVSTTTNFRIGEEEWGNELNMTTTDPFALQKLLKKMKRAGVDWVILEVTSHALDQHRVWGVPIHTAVMTNLSPDHLDYHGTIENYAAAKAKLLRMARKVVVLNHDDEWYEYFRQTPRHAVYSYGENEEASVRFDRTKYKADKTSFRLRYGQRIIHLDLQLPGKFNVYNALAAATVAYGVDIDWQHVQNGLERLSGVPGRMEPVRAGQAFPVLIDYAHTPDAFENVLKSVKPLTKGKVIVVFGGAPTHDYAGFGAVAGELANVVIVTDDEPMDVNPKEIRQKIAEAARESGHAEIREVSDRRNGIAEAFNIASAKDTVMLLGLGHQKYRRIKGKRIEWSEKEVAQELLHKIHANNGKK